jgi:hypothetical protein
MEHVPDHIRSISNKLKRLSRSISGWNISHLMSATFVTRQDWEGVIRTGIHWASTCVLYSFEFWIIVADIIQYCLSVTISTPIARICVAVDRRRCKEKRQRQSAGHCFSGVCNYYPPWKYFTLATSVVGSRRLTACALWHGQNLPSANYVPIR